jgi:hypothetical protein
MNWFDAWLERLELALASGWQRWFLAHVFSPNPTQRQEALAEEVVLALLPRRSWRYYRVAGRRWWQTRRQGN